ncbi:TasA family protein, partial [Blastococcus sp. LR1]|uniref:TasA family protein n=1 Tax=Blastococcus sp. LR1 TaxID=2877000 RepID=UPI0027146FA4
MTKTLVATSSTARKVVGSLGVIGAAAAVAGIGTFGTFTDSTTPVNTTLDTGTLSITATQQGTLPLTISNLVPGDTVTRAVTVKNDGNLPFGSLTLGTTVAAPSVLTTDAVNGLQLAVKSCAVAWVQSGNGFTCSSGEKTLGSGPVAGNINLAGAASLNAGATDFVAYTVSLPTTADNTFQGKSAALSLVFTGTQKTGTA